MLKAHAGDSLQDKGTKNFDLVRRAAGKLGESWGWPGEVIQWGRAPSGNKRLDKTLQEEAGDVGWGPSRVNGPKPEEGQQIEM